MNRFLKLSLLASWVLCTVSSCKSKEKSLPEPTTQGLNTFGCKINGKTWIAEGGSHGQGPGARPIELEFRSLSATTFYLMIHTRASSGDRVQLTLPHGTLGANTLTNRYDEPFGIYYDNQFRIFDSMESNPGNVNITRLDTVSHIISGTFHFDAQFIVDKQIVRITDGRFDIDIDSL